MEAKKTSRRRLLGMSAATVGAATIAVADGWMTPAQAADGDPVLLATTNQANNPRSSRLSTAARLASSFAPARTAVRSSVRTRQATAMGSRPLASPSVSWPWVDRQRSTRSATTELPRGAHLRRHAVSASTAVDAGLALEVKGAVSFSRSGRVKVPAGAVRDRPGQRSGHNNCPGHDPKQAAGRLHRGSGAESCGPDAHHLADAAAKTPTTVAWFLLD
jgi:hypothetical protein